MRRWMRVFVGASLAVAIIIGACKKDDDDDDILKRIRLFSIDSAADTIRELNAKTGADLNAFLAPGPGISGTGCGLAYDSLSGVLYFHDSLMGPEIWAIDPDDPDPTGTAVALVTPAPAPDYVGLAHDGIFLMALRPGVEQIDWLIGDLTSPSSGDRVASRDYFPEDLEEGIDASGDALFSAGRNAAGEWVLFHLDFSGGVITEFVTAIPGFIPGAVGYAGGIVFISDMGNFEIIVVNIASGNLIAQFPIQGATSVCGLAAGGK